MKLRYHHYRLQFTHTFHIAAGARDTTDAVYVSLEQDGITGYGEIALPPYLQENVSTVFDFLSNTEIPVQYHPDQFFTLLEQWSNNKQINYPALAALDIALHDLQGKMLNIPLRKIYKIEDKDLPFTAFTLGMSDALTMKHKLEEAKEYHLYKLKMGGSNDAELLSNFRSLTSKPFCVDANRGWDDEESAALFCNQLKSEGCLFAEQPFEKLELRKTASLRLKTTLPVILDETVQTVSDVERVKECCDGINIKLVKCGGLYPAIQMIEKARTYNLKVFIGCMSEGSCGCGSAAQIAGLADWVDLDGPLLIKNDPFEGLNYIDGRIVLNNKPGNGLTPGKDFLNNWQ